MPSHGASFWQRRQSRSSTPSLADAWIGRIRPVLFKSERCMSRWPYSGSLQEHDYKPWRDLKMELLNAGPRRERALTACQVNPVLSCHQPEDLHEATEE
jgi:hypothetical protein